MMSTVKARKRRKPTGRPRCFNERAALEGALQVFWRKGYQGASLSDLTRAMGIHRPSLYATFGDKEALFRKVLDRYIEGPVGYVSDALRQPTVDGVLDQVFRGFIDMNCDPRNPKGCLLVQGALACGQEAEPVKRELVARRTTGEAAFRRRFERAKKEGDLPPSVDPADLARFLVTVLHGMAVRSAGGSTRAELRKIAAMAKRCWLP
jgi:AcrR family transcriptional regulator